MSSGIEKSIYIKNELSTNVINKKDLQKEAVL